MPKKFKVVQVTIRRATGVDNYAKYAGQPGKDMKELLAGVAAFANWTVDVKGDKVIGAHPAVAKHPGHVDGKDWKLQVETGKASQDRLFVKVTGVEEVPAKNDPNVVNVKIKANVTVVEDTHKRESRK